jgi:enediyne biosynthesis protein E4
MPGMLITIAAMTLALGPGSGASCVQDEVSPEQDAVTRYGYQGQESSATSALHHRTLLVRTERGWEPLEIAAPFQSAIVPLVTRSEVVLRPDVGPDGIELATIEVEGGEPATLLVQACVHHADQQLIQIGRHFVLVGEPRLVEGRVEHALEGLTTKRTRSDGLPWIARRDRLTTFVSTDQRPPEGLEWVVGVGPRTLWNRPVILNSDGNPMMDPAAPDWDADPFAFAAPPRVDVWEVLSGPADAASPRWMSLNAGHEWPRRAHETLGTTAEFDQVFATDFEPAPAPIAVPVARGEAWPVPLDLVPPRMRAFMLDLPRDSSALRCTPYRLTAPDAGDSLTVTLVVTVVDPAESLSIGHCGFTVDRSADRGRPTLVGSSIATSSRREGQSPHLEGPDEQLDIRPTMGPGAAWGDVNLDGWSDLYVVQGAGRAGSTPPSNRMFGSSEADWGEGGPFSLLWDATDTWGGADTGAGMGALFLDADGDRDLDLFVANYGADVLFENLLEQSADGTPQLVDVSAAAGVGGDLWSAGICAGDVDNDGDLDLYVTSYLEYDESKMPSLEDLPYQREDPVAMLPFAFPGQRNQLLINESTPDGLRFVDRAKEWRAADELGRGMQPIMFDFDRDGWLDLYVANDVSPNLLLKNNKDGRFRDVSFATGMDDPRGGMGVALGDVDLDGDEDLFLTNWELEPNALYTSNLQAHASQRHRVATFRDTIVKSGLGPHGVGVTSWAAVLFDLENDGDLDLFVANGYTSPDYESTGICVGQPDHLFVNDGRGKFTVAHEKIAPFAENGGRDLPSRCAIDCDFDRDGDVDLFVTANNSAYRLLENHTREPGAPSAEGAGHWLGVVLLAPAPNTYAIGARVEVVTDRRTFVRTLLAGSGYLGGNAPELHFGLGAAERLERVVVHPPGHDAATDGPVAPRVFTPEDTAELALDRWVTLDLR